MRKSELYEKLLTPFLEKRRMDFPDFVKAFTAGITRMHIGDYIYKEDDFVPASWQFYKDDLIGHRDYSIHLEDLPKQYKHLSLDTPFTTKKWLEAFSDVRDEVKEPNNVKIRDRVVRNFTDIGMSEEEWWSTYDKGNPITYNINSLGLRSDLEFEDLVPNEFIPVFGCSHTQGVGTAEKDIWWNKIGENLPIFNCGLSASGPMEVYLLLRQLYEQKPFEKTYVCVPHSERTAHISNKRIIEGGVHYQQVFLKEFEHIHTAINMETKNMYTSITVSAIEDFCKAHDIELKMYAKNTFQGIKDFINWDIIAPPLTKMYIPILGKELKIVDPNIHTPEQIKNACARDLIHYGVNWHDKIAEYMTG